MVSTNLNKEHFMWRSSWNFYFWISLIDNLVDIIIAMVQIIENTNNIAIIAHDPSGKIFDICYGWEPGLENASTAKETGAAVYEAIFVIVYTGICGGVHKEILKIRWRKQKEKRNCEIKKKRICGWYKEKREYIVYKRICCGEKED
eukprot:445877_1